MDDDVWIRKVSVNLSDFAASTVSTFVGEGVAGITGGVGSSARLAAVKSLATSPDGKHLLVTQV